MKLAPDAHRRLWLARLAKLVSPAFPTDATEALIEMLPFLRDFPEAAFADASLEAVALAKRRQSTPALDELRAALAAWWRDNDPVPRLAAPPNADLPPDREPPTAAEVAEVAAKLTAWRRETTAAQRLPDALDRLAKLPTTHPLLLRALYEEQLKQGGVAAHLAAARLAHLPRRERFEEDDKNILQRV